jgi:HTH domain
METLARRLSRSPRTIQRHLHLLKEKGLIEFVERKRDWHGRFGAYLYREVHIAAATVRKKGAEVDNRKDRWRKTLPTTGHGGPMASNKRQTKQQEVPPYPPRDVKEATSGSSATRGRMVSKKHIVWSWKRGAARKQKDAERATTGFLNRIRLSPCGHSRYAILEGG